MIKAKPADQENIFEKVFIMSFLFIKWTGPNAFQLVFFSLIYFCSLPGPAFAKF